MKAAGFREKLDDAMNPIVVKELRQAVHSRFVVAVVLLFLLIQLVFLGIYLMTVGIGGRLESIDYQAGRDVFSWLQALLLATCMLFLPAYTGVRLAAERSEVNTDLLFITTLQPRKIVSGKLASAVVIAVMIFSACAPFMAFTYFLRGIDLVSIFFVVAIDFLVVIGSVHLMVLLAVIPCNRVLKAFLGVFGFGALLFIFGMTISGTVAMVQMGFTPLFEDQDFFAICGAALVGYVGYCGLTFAWSIGLISAPSANRALPMRVFILTYCLISLGVLVWLCQGMSHEGPFTVWILLTFVLAFLVLIIAINERVRWSSRVARTIPKNPLLRVPAFLVYSGAAGGVLFACLLAGIGALGVYLFTNGFLTGVGVRRIGLSDTFFRVLGIGFLQFYCYALTAVFLHRFVFRSLSAGLTWVVLILVLAFGFALPPLLSYFITYGSQWRYEEQYAWMLPNTAAAMIEFYYPVTPHQDVFLYFTLIWAGVATLLNVPWFFRQMRAFRPFDGSNVTPLPVVLLDGSSETLPIMR